MTSPGHVRYAAFLSYSRDADAELAPALQSALQRLAKPWNSLRALRVFRDDAGMAANPDLWAGIRRALDESEFLILLASPGAAASPWVDREVAYWLATKPRENLMIGLTAGAIVWSGGDFDRERTTSIPPALFGAFGGEPRWIDLTGLRPADLSLQVPVFRDRVADLAAPLHHQDKDELFSDDVSELRRTRRLVRSAIAVLSVLTLLAAGAAVVAFSQRGVARVARIGEPVGGRLAEDVALNRDGSLLAVRYDEDSVHLIEVGAPGRTVVLEEFQESLPEDRPGALVFNRAGTALAGSTQNGTTRIWPLAGAFGRPPKPVVIGTRHAASFNLDAAAAFSPDSRLLATGGSGNEIQLWNVADPRRPVIAGPPLTGHTGSVADLAFAADGRTLVSASQDRTLRLWDVRDPEVPAPLGPALTGHAAAAAFVAFGPDPGSLISLDRDGAVRWWRRPPARATAPGRVAELEFSTDGAEVVAGERDGSDERWSTRDPALGPPTTSNPSDQDIMAVRLDRGRVSILDNFARAGTGEPSIWPEQMQVSAFSPDGAVVAFSPLPRDGDTDQVFLHRAGMARPVGVGYPPPGDTIGIDAIAFRPDGRLLAVGDTHGTIRTWDISDLDHPQPVGAEQHGHTDSVTALAFAPDGRTLVSTSFDGSVRVWRLTAAGVASPAGHITDLGDRVTSAAFAPDGSLFATAGLDGALRLWDPATAAAAGPPIVAQDDRIATVRWSPDGSRLAVAGDASAGLIDLDPAHAIARVCASADWIGPDQWRTRVSPELPYTRIC